MTVFGIFELFFFLFLFVFVFFIKNERIDAGDSYSKYLVLFFSVLVFMISFSHGLFFEYDWNYVWADVYSFWCVIFIFFGPLLTAGKSLGSKINSRYSLIFFTIFSFLQLLGAFGIFAEFPVFKNSVLTTTLISYINILSLTNFFNNRYKRWNLFLYFVTWLICLFSMSKWTFVIVVVLPIVFYLKIGVRYWIFTAILVAPLIFLILDNLDIIVSRSDFEDFDTFISLRVFSFYDVSNNLIWNIIYNGDLSLLDGGRYLIWNETKLKFSQSMFGGLGFGFRALGNYVEDHNLFVFYISRVGLFGIVLTFFLYKLISMIGPRKSKYLKNQRGHLYYIFILHSIVLSISGMQWKSSILVVFYIFLFNRLRSHRLYYD